MAAATAAGVVGKDGEQEPAVWWQPPRQLSATGLARRGLRVVLGDGDVFVAGARAEVGGSGGDAFVARYTESEGNVTEVWRQNIATADSEASRAIACCDDGGVLVGGVAAPLAGDSKGFLMKFSGGGLPLWSKQIDTSGADTVEALVVGPGGFLFTAGAVGSGGIDASERRAFVCKYSAAGDVLWVRQLGNDAYGGANFASGIAAASTGAVFVVGGLSAASGTLEDPPVAFLAKFTAGGDAEWLSPVELGAAGAPAARSIALGAQDAVFVVGEAGNISEGGGRDAFLAKYSADGDYEWGRSFGVGLHDGGESIAVGADGSIVMGGVLSGGPPNGRNAFVMKYTAEGVSTWAKQLTTPNEDVVSSVAIGADGSVYVAVTSNPDGWEHTSFLRKYTHDGTTVWTEVITSVERPAPEPSASPTAPPSADAAPNAEGETSGVGESSSTAGPSTAGEDGGDVLTNTTRSSLLSVVSGTSSTAPRQLPLFALLALGLVVAGT